MKKIFTYFGIFLSVILMGLFTSCKTQELEQTGDLGLSIKVFSPTKVVTGQPMTINGTGLSDVTEIIFPNGVSVTSFEVVSNEMIRLTAPAGIAAEGGNLIVRTDKDQVESRLPVTLGNTVISGYSKQAGEEAEGGELITIFGKDLEFITAVELLDADGNPNLVTQETFYRKGTSSVIFYVPRTNIFEGTFVGHVYTYDGKEFDMPELSYKPKQESGHWEIVKTYFWENEDGTPIPAWGGTFRFSSAEASTGEEIYAFPMDQWNTIKEGTVRVSLDNISDASNIRITTGWWSAAYGGSEHNCLDFVQEDEDGVKYIELNIKEEGTIYELIDAQHLLFTGSDYTLTAIYTQEEIWVPGEEGHWEKKSFWKNDGTPIPAWGGTFRFSSAEASTGEEIYAFPMEEWSTIKEGTVRVGLDNISESSNIRITTGWWSAAYGGSEHNCLDFVQEEEDGSKYIELNIKEEGSLYELIDAQHLLFTGDSYTLTEIYVMEWVEGGGGAGKTPTVMWENDGTPIPGWGGTFRFSSAEASTGEEIYAFPMEDWSVIKEGKFRVSVDANEGSNIRITTGWWTGAYGGADHNCIDMIQEEEDGTKYIEINIKEDGNLYDNIDAQHLLFTGDAYTLLKIYYYK